MQAYAHDACMSMHDDVARQCHAGAHTTTRIYVYMYMYVYHDNYTIRTWSPADLLRRSSRKCKVDLQVRWRHKTAFFPGPCRCFSEIQCTFRTSLLPFILSVGKQQSSVGQKKLKKSVAYGFIRRSGNPDSNPTARVRWADPFPGASVH